MVAQSQPCVARAPISRADIEAEEPAARGSRLQLAIERGQALGKAALYFGCWDQPGHYLHRPCGYLSSDDRRAFELPWADFHMDSGLLKNGRHPDTCDGRVFWTCGGKALWYAFFWWDRSGDKRGASNSGFYVRGFGWPEAQAALDYACAEFPHIVARQKHPLILQGRPPIQPDASVDDGAPTRHSLSAPDDQIPSPPPTPEDTKL